MQKLCQGRHLLPPPFRLILASKALARVITVWIFRSADLQKSRRGAGGEYVNNSDLSQKMRPCWCYALRPSC